jgi:hypothetical protein
MPDRPRIVAYPECLPESAVARLRAIADEYPDAECVVAGGLDLADLYPVEDGPGSGRRVELTVRVLVGTERSTVIVADPVTGRALAHQVVPHGAEPGAAAPAVASLVEDGIAEGSRDV